MTFLPSITGAATRRAKNSPVSLSNDKITQCKVCGFGVFKHQSYRWAAEPLGISHTECLDKENTDG